MKVITCAGFYRTGSSAISHMFSEFENVYSFGDFEFRFIQDPDGISDLEYNICENPHRHNTSYAIKRFIKYSKFLNGSFYSKRYSGYFGEDYMKYTMDYVNNITELICKTWWHRDQIDRGGLFYFLDRVYSHIYYLFDRRKFNTSMLKNELGYYTSIDKDRFYAETRNYINRLLNLCNKDNKEFLMLDQLVPPTNIARYLNYFDDLKVIVVERDPRDLYIIENESYAWGIMPYKNVKEFCEWYKITRKQAIHPENPNVIWINFEDLIYKYEKTRQKLMDFTGVTATEGDRKKTIFRPDVSINNTLLYKKLTKYQADVEYIEKELPDFLYTVSEEKK